jgi:hypothetical protein
MKNRTYSLGPYFASSPKGDVPEDSAFQVGSTNGQFIQLDWQGTLRREGDQFVAEAECLNSRKYWYSPLGLEQFMDLVRRSVETRQRTRGDVALQDYDDDGAYNGDVVP